jgi:hypothetical protein
MRPYLPLTLTAGLLAAAASAQNVDLTIKPSKDKALRYTITSQSEISNDREMIINGEPREGGPGGMSGVTKTDVQVEFDEGSADNQTWRAYRKAEAVVERPGFDGELSEQKVSGGLAGKKVFLSEDDGGVVARENDAKGKTLPAAMTRGLPVSTTFAGFAPKEPVGIGQEFDLSASLPKALKSLVHPVRPQVDENAEGAPGQRGRRGGGEGQGQGQGQGGRGGEQGADEEGQARGRRGGRGGEGGFGGGGRGPGGFGRGGVQDTALETAVNDKLTCKASGKLVSVEERDGMKLATVSFNATMSGKGTPTQLGIGAFGGGRFGGGGRGFGGGGRGGQGGEPQEDTGKAEANVTLTGSMVIDVNSHTLRELTIDGKLKTTSQTKHSFERPDTGEEMDIEVNADADGTFKVKVVAATPEK